MRGWFFVVPPVYHVPNSRLLLQLLNESHDYIPLERTKKILLLNKNQIVYVRMDKEKAEDRDPGILQKEVRVTLPTQQELSGTVAVDLPEERRRVLDFLNLNAAFFLLDTRREVYLINKTLIQDVVPLD